MFLIYLSGSDFPPGDAVFLVLTMGVDKAPKAGVINTIPLSILILLTHFVAKDICSVANLFSETAASLDKMYKTSFQKDIPKYTWPNTFIFLS